MKLEDYEALVKDKKCNSCHGSLGKIKYYPHAGGWRVDGFSERVWLYKVCKKCGYEWALWKLGVERDKT